MQRLGKLVFTDNCYNARRRFDSKSRQWYEIALISKSNLSAKQVSDLATSSPTQADGSYRKGLVMLVATGGILFIVSWIFIFWDLDRSIAARFYTPEKGWFLKEAEPWNWLFHLSCQLSFSWWP